MPRISGKYVILTGLLAAINILGLFWIHHSLTKAPKPTARVISLVVSPDVDLADQLSLTFDRQMVQPAAVGQVEKTAVFKLTPEWPGEWTWSAPDKLDYMLAKRLPAGRVFRISSTQELEHRTGRTLEGDNEFEFKTKALALDRSELVAFDNSDVTFRVVFNQPVDPGDLLRHISFRDDSTKAKLGEPVCLTQTPRENLVVRFRRPESNRFEMVLDEQLAGSGAELGLGRPVVCSHEIPPGFSLLNVHAARPTLEEIASVQLEFSHELSVEQELPEVTIEPAIEESTAYRSSSNLTVTGKFEAGKRYTITVPGTLLSKGNKTLEEDKSISVHIPEYCPSFEFVYRKGILSPLGNLKLDVRAVNIEGLKLKAWRVHANNLISHLHDPYYTEKTSRLMATEELELDLPANKPQKLTLDLRNLLPVSTGIYRISANVTNTRWTNGRALLTVTDLAITAKAERDGSLVWITSLRTGEPVPDVQVRALSFNNQTLSSAKTDRNGVARLKFASNHPDGKMWVITAQKDGDVSHLQPEDNQWVIDDVPQSGRPYARNYEVMLYTERGVYRPGDTIHVTAIIRGRAGDTPPPFPLAVKIARPDGRQVAELIAKPLDTDQGVFHAEFATRTDCQTGPYRIRVTLPGSDENLGSAQTLVECFMPIRMEVKAKPASERFGPNTPPSVEVSGRYLWDEPAANIPVTVTGTLQPIQYQSKRHADYKFGWKTDQRVVSLPDSQGKLDEKGCAELQVQLPESFNAGLYRMRLSATVTEPGGRSVSANASTTLDMLDRYVGLRLPSGQVVSIGRPLEVDWVRLTGDDKPAPEGELRMRLVRVEYDTVLQLVDNRRVWKSTERTKEVNTELVIATSGAEGSFEVVCPDPGTYRIILTDGLRNSPSSLEFYASEYSAGPQTVPMNQPERLKIVTDKDKYVPGQTAKVLIRSPIPGRFLLTVENDSVVAVHTGTIKNNTAELQVPLSENLRGGVFLTATVLRAVDPQQENWLPHRAMGMTRVLLDHGRRQLPMKITGPASAKPGETVRVTVDAGLPTDPNRPTLVHLWAVDEGILLTTYYEAPDSHGFFLGPRKLGVSTADIFLRLLPDYKRPAGTIRIGADDFGLDSLRRNPVPAKHRQAAVVWRRAIPVDENGQVSAKLKLPDLIGQMRLMAVAVDHDRYGRAERAMTLTSPLIIETTWPRFVAPQDEFEVPVKLFNSTEQPLTVQVKASLTGPVEVKADEALDKVLVNPGQPAALLLRARAMNIGPVEVSVEAIELGTIAEPLTAQSRAAFSVRPAAALHSEVEVKAIKAGEQFRIQPPQSFVEGTARMTVSVSSRPSVQLGPALEDLIRYPYGCVEQTSSRLFSLLYASDVLGDDRTEMINSMVRAGIARLWSMQTRSGGLSYWPGGSTPDLWGTAYAASCLLEAKNAGYEIDPQFASELTKYLDQRLKTTGDDSPDLNTKALICRVLAVFGEPPQGWMARLFEQKDQLDLAAAAHLAAAFHAAGHKDGTLALIPEQLPQNLGKTTTTGRLTSPIRQQAVLLSVLLEIGPEHPAVAVLARRLDEARRGCRWGSTLNNAAAIAALSRYQAIMSKEKQDFSGTVKLADREVAAFDHNAPVSHTFENISQQVVISSDGNGTVYVVVLSEGLAGKGLIKPFDQGLHVERNWTDRHGNPIDPNKLSVGDLVRVKATVSTPGPVVHNIALVDALPGGMEVENPRLATSAESNHSQSNRPDHVEFLDDRVVLFCTADKTRKNFEYALRVTTAGKFALPPIQASCMYEPNVASLGPEGQLTILSRRQAQANGE
ncbi:MAG: hypothetical protein ISS70_07210 [Phycisphaerae bacterium]|nr:hypothetical protein [Phycisphaerae bacterium]